MRECETEISIFEGGNIVVQARRINLRPGVNEIDLRPADNYRFRCVNQRSAWSMRESGDRSRWIK